MLTWKNELGATYACVGAFRLNVWHSYVGYWPWVVVTRRDDSELARGRQPTEAQAKAAAVCALRDILRRDLDALASENMDLAQYPEPEVTP